MAKILSRTRKVGVSSQVSFSVASGRARQMRRSSGRASSGMVVFPWGGYGEEALAGRGSRTDTRGPAPTPRARLRLHLRRVERRTRRHDAPAVAERIHHPAGAAVRLVLERALHSGAGSKRSFERRIRVIHLDHERGRVTAEVVRREHAKLWRLVREHEHALAE